MRDDNGEHLALLLQALQNPDRAIQVQAATQLGELGDCRAVPALIDALDTTASPIVLEHIVSALRQLGDAQAVVPLIRTFRWGDQVYEVVRDALFSFGERTIPALIEALHDPDWSIRESVVATLGMIPDAQAVEPLISVLQEDNHDWVRMQAAVTLGLLKDPRAVAPLVKVLKDRANTRLVRTRTAWALGRMRDGGGIRLIIAVLRDPSEDDDVRAWAAMGSAESGDTRAQEILLRSLSDPNMRVREGVASGLGQLGDQNAVNPLLQALQREKYLLAQSRIIEALGQIGDRRAVVPLIQLLGDGNHHWLTQQSAAEALGKLNDLRAVEPLISVLKSEESRVRAAAAVALGQLGDPRALPSLEWLAQHDPCGPSWHEANVKQAAAEAVERIRAAGP